MNWNTYLLAFVMVFGILSCKDAKTESSEPTAAVVQDSIPDEKDSLEVQDSFSLSEVAKKEEEAPKTREPEAESKETEPLAAEEADKETEKEEVKEVAAKKRPKGDPMMYCHINGRTNLQLTKKDAKNFKIEAYDIWNEKAYKVTLFKANVSGNGSLRVTGGKANNQLASMIDRAEIGDIIMFFDIRDDLNGRHYPCGNIVVQISKQSDKARKEMPDPEKQAVCTIQGRRQIALPKLAVNGRSLEVAPLSSRRDPELIIKSMELTLRNGHKQTIKGNKLESPEIDSIQRGGIVIQAKVIVDSEGNGGYHCEPVLIYVQ